MGCVQSNSSLFIGPHADEDSLPKPGKERMMEGEAPSSAFTGNAQSELPCQAENNSVHQREGNSRSLPTTWSTSSPRASTPGDCLLSPRLAAVAKHAAASVDPGPHKESHVHGKVVKKRTLPVPFSAKGWLAFPAQAPINSGPRRPATNPTPTSNHDVLLNASLTQSQGIVVALTKTTGGESGISARGRRPRPLAIPTDSHFHLSTILGHLLIGGDEVSDNLTVMRQLNIKSVVNTTTEGDDSMGELCYLKLNWRDDIAQPILPDLPRAFAAIDAAKAQGGLCLVHCKKGMSRSGAVVVAYLMYSNKDMSLLEALTYARSRRAIIAPNMGFMGQLVEWEREHRGGKVSLDLSKYEENRFGDTAMLLCGA